MQESIAPLQECECAVCHSSAWAAAADPPGAASTAWRLQAGPSGAALTTPAPCPSRVTSILQSDNTRALAFQDPEGRVTSHTWLRCSDLHGSQWPGPAAWALPQALQARPVDQEAPTSCMRRTIARPPAQRCWRTAVLHMLRALCGATARDCYCTCPRPHAAGPLFTQYLQETLELRQGGGWRRVACGKARRGRLPATCPP